MSLAFHSYTQAWLVPWGYAVNAYPADYQDLFDLAVRAFQARRFPFTVENSAGLYPASGNDATICLSLAREPTVDVSFNHFNRCLR